MTRLLDRFPVLLGHVHDLERLAERRVVEDVLLALDDVDVAGEQLARADGKLQRIRVLREAVAGSSHAAIEVGAGAVHLVREDHARDHVAVRLAPHGLRLRLDAGDGIEQRDGAVEHAKRTLHFDCEVDVARRVDDVDAVLDRRCASRTAVVAADVIVMPRSCSCSIQSIVAAPSCTSPILWRLPV